ncbi:MAG: lipoyl(octanoyl) transferase LipB [Mariprofundaceae bacterium]|nr:lipoyl(octanoyl) transferase LipB [Mariprofundaceae bacterium]
MSRVFCFKHEIPEKDFGHDDTFFGVLMMLHEFEKKWLGRQAYVQQWKKLQHHARELAQHHAHEMVLGCEHEPIYTTGKRGIDNRYSALSAPLLSTDRGGETTFHGLGQVMFYPVIHLRQRGISVRTYIETLEDSAIQLLQYYDIEAYRWCGKPGVWTSQGKIVAIGIRVRNGVAYHGMALNVHVDMDYFHAINPCGLSLKAANMCDFNTPYPPLADIFDLWFDIFQRQAIFKTES